MIKFLFWSSAFLVCWAFALYPAVIVAIAAVSGGRRWRSSPYTGRLSIVVAAHNEKAVIRAKVENSLTLDFGETDWELIIVSDGSDDGTNEILATFDHRHERLKIITYHPRQGKANALNVGLAAAIGDVIVFSDANVILEKMALGPLLAPFADPQVGAVCGRVLVKAEGDEIAGESLYMLYEGGLQRAESVLSSMVGADGALFALRRECCRPLSAGTILDDFALSMEAPLTGKRIVYANDAKAVEEVIASAADEFRRKVRIVAGGFQYLAAEGKRLASLSPALIVFFLSHKLLRWIAPFLMMVVLTANLGLVVNDIFYMVVLALQGTFYGLAAIAYILPEYRKKHLFYLPYYFCTVNMAAFIGVLRFLAGRQMGLWKKVARGCA